MQNAEGKEEKINLISFYKKTPGEPWCLGALVAKIFHRLRAWSEAPHEKLLCL
jgi:hypothetical protein